MTLRARTPDVHIGGDAVAERMSVQMFAMAGRPWQLATQRLLRLIQEDQARA